MYNAADESLAGPITSGGRVTTPRASKSLPSAKQGGLAATMAAANIATKDGGDLISGNRGE